MIYKAKKGQTSYGESIGILLLDTFCPFIPGDVGNATSYDYPVRFKKVQGLTVQKIFELDSKYLFAMIEAAKELQREGVRAITGDCGFMAIYQEELKEQLNLPVFLSSLLQIPFIRSMLKSKEKLGIITANAEVLTEKVFQKIGLEKDDKLIIVGLEESPAFKQTVIAESGFLDKATIEKEVIDAALLLQKKDKSIGAILLECSMLPPYGAVVQRATGLPVFDFLTMIDYVYSSLNKKEF